MDLEFHQLELKHQQLRIMHAARQRRLVASLLEEGQQSPVLVVAAEDRWVLIDGYRRVAALKALGRDTVWAMALEMSEAQALLFRYELGRSGQYSALEEGWLLDELHQTYDMSQAKLAARFGRSPSWVSRRLALARDLPPSVEELVRQGTVCAHAAMKHLVPLARANVEQCQLLVGHLNGAYLSERQVGQLYAAWREGDAEQRQAIVDDPLLYLKTVDELAQRDPSPPSAQENVEDGLEALRRLCWRLRRLLKESLKTKEGSQCLTQLARGWLWAREAFYALEELFKERRQDAGPTDP